VSVVTQSAFGIQHRIHSHDRGVDPGYTRPVPLGLGSFEAGSAGMLSLLGVPLPVALAATLLLRGFTLWLPLLPGLILMRGSFKHYGSKSKRVVAHR
jgi:hypothetical protein